MSSLIMRTSPQQEQGQLYNLNILGSILQSPAFVAGIRIPLHAYIYQCRSLNNFVNIKWIWVKSLIMPKSPQQQPGQLYNFRYFRLAD